MKNGVDDVAFTRGMLDRLEADLCVDPRRVFATGMSNGGFMSHRLACEMSDRIAAVAPVSGVNTLATCTPTRAVSVLDFHGTADPTVPYAGGTEFHWPSVEQSTSGWIARWLRRDGGPDDRHW
jgi:polyhydroxybutyrate depolymerase